MAIAVASPVRAVAENQHAALAFARAQRQAERRAIGEQKRIACLEVDFQRCLDFLQAVSLPPCRKCGVDDVRPGAARDAHRAAVDDGARDGHSKRSAGRVKRGS